MLRPRPIWIGASSLFLLSSLALAQGCSAAPTPSEAHDSVSEEIIGGVDAKSASLDAVGVLLLSVKESAPPSSNTGTSTASAPLGKPVSLGKIDLASRPQATIAGKRYFQWCTGTLISPTVVLTAEHCKTEIPPGFELSFGTGYDVTQTKTIVPVLTLMAEETITGGAVGFGADVAVAHLYAPIEGVAYYQVGALKPSDIGQRFAAIGFGTQTTRGKIGTRKTGSLTLKALEGKVFGLAYGSFDEWLPRTPELFGFPPALLNDPSTLAELKAAYDETLLIKDYEAFLGVGRGDVQPCHGDSGGPLVAPGRKIVGIASWVTHSNGTFCKDGVVYASLGPAVQTFVQERLADACSGVSETGLCRGTEAFRCTREDEGVRRLTQSDCSILGQTCGLDETGAAACVDP